MIHRPYSLSDSFARAAAACASVCLALAGLLAGGHAAAQDSAARGNAIVIGQSVALTGPSAALALPFHQGAKLVFDKVNAAGGIDGRRIELVTLDDAGEAVRTVDNTGRLLAQNPLLLFGYYGSPQVVAAYPAFKDGEVILFGPMASADELRGSLYPNVFTLRPGFAEEAAAVTRHAETLGTKRIAILHGTDSESMNALDSATRTAHGMGADLVATVPFAQMDRALNARAQAVLVLGDAPSAGKAIRDLRARAFRGPIYAFSSTGESLLAEQVGAAGAGVVLVRVTPKSDNMKTPVVRELLADAAAAKLKPSVYMLEGYIAARTLVFALRKAGRDTTRAKLRKTIEGMNEIDVGGFRVSFDGDRVGSRLVELSLIDSQGRVRE